MGCDIHIRAEIREPSGEWRMLGKVFPEERGFHWEPAKREFMETLRDGQLADALAHHVRSPRGGEASEFGATLSEPLRDALAAYAERREADEAGLQQWREEVAEKLKAEDPETFSDRILADDLWRERQQRDNDVRAERVRGFELDAALREELIEKADAWRYDYEDEDERRLTLDLRHIEGDPPFMTPEPWDGRNYDLFAILADVRNGRGFAGIATGEGFNPISPPRGVPSDASEEGAAFMDSYGVDGHSQTWHTLAELDAYDWDGQETTIYGVVPLVQYERMQAEGNDRPVSYSGGISGRGVVTFTPDGYEAWVEAGKPPLEDAGFSLNRIVSAGEVRSLGQAEGAAGSVKTQHGEFEVAPYIHMAWRESYRQAAGEAWFRTMERLRELAPNGDTEAIRVIAFFDN